MIAASGSNKIVLSITDMTEEEINDAHYKQKLEEYRFDLQLANLNTYIFFCFTYLIFLFLLFLFFL
jgi:hypothetical protein